MRGTLVAAALTLGASSAAAQKYEFSATISSEFWNFNDTTGQGLGLVRAGDTVKGTFNYTGNTGVFRNGNTAVFFDPVLSSRLEVYRAGDLVVTLTQAPAFFSNGEPVSQSQLFARNGDPTGARDTLTVSVGGDGGFDPADPTGTVVTAIKLSPFEQNILIPGWTLAFREKCSSGSVAGGNCVSNAAGLDYYNGTQSSFDLEAAFRNNSLADLSLTFQYAGTPGEFDGNFEQATGALSALSAVPEPYTWAMMLSGFGLLGAAARRRTRTSIAYA